MSTSPLDDIAHFRPRMTVAAGLLADRDLEPGLDDLESRRGSGGTLELGARYARGRVIGERGRGGDQSAGRGGAHGEGGQDETRACHASMAPVSAHRVQRCFSMTVICIGDDSRTC